MKISAALTIAALILTAPVLSAQAAQAADFTANTRLDFRAAGKHQFYVFCTAGDDRISYQSGASARDAKAKLAATLGAGCTATWQGRVSG